MDSVGWIVVFVGGAAASWWLPPSAPLPPLARLPAAAGSAREVPTGPVVADRPPTPGPHSTEAHRSSARSACGDLSARPAPSAVRGFVTVPLDIPVRPTASHLLRGGRLVLCGTFELIRWCPGARKVNARPDGLRAVFEADAVQDGCG